MAGLGESLAAHQVGRAAGGGLLWPTYRIWLPSLLLWLLQLELRPLSRDIKRGSVSWGASSPAMLGRAHPSKEWP